LYNIVEYTYEDTTVYAKWTPVTTVTIIAEGPIYDSYNGKYLESPFKITFPIGESHSLEYLLEGIDFYNFVIDNTLHSYSEVFLDEEDNIFTLDSIIDSDITLTVKYVLPLNITFNGNGGIVYNEMTAITYNDILSGTKLIDLGLSPYREGYSFVGWYCDNVKFEGGNWKIASDVELIAKWAANSDTSYTVNHHLQNVDDENYYLSENEKLYGYSDSIVEVNVKNYEDYYSSSEEHTYNVTGILFSETKFSSAKNLNPETCRLLIEALESVKLLTLTKTV